MQVLVLNCGSSSLKFALFTVSAPAAGGADRRRLASGAVERLGRAARVRFRAGATTADEVADIADHDAAVRHVLDWLDGAPGLPRIDAVGHRVVHGGDRFVKPVLVDAAVIDAIEALEELAPLHNAPSVAAIRACGTRLGSAIPMVASFDTAFHVTMPSHAASYPIPGDLAARHRVRRYGFHGTSYRHVLERYCAVAGLPRSAASCVVLHLGAGCSAVAIRGGVSVDTSMGLTPLEGLMMGTRSGDLDPALVGFLAAREAVPVTTVTDWLHARSGLLGVSGRSADVRDLLAAEAEDERARLALEMFCYRARKYVGAYLAVLGGAQAVVFTGGIGEHHPPIRARICAGMEWCGLTVDPARNAAAGGDERPANDLAPADERPANDLAPAGERLISPDGGAVRVWVIPTDEELMIARDTAECLAAAVIPGGRS